MEQTEQAQKERFTEFDKRALVVNCGAIIVIAPQKELVKALSAACLD